MWWIYALLSAVFAALTAIFAKIGIKGVDTDLATAIRTVVVLIFSMEHCFFSGEEPIQLIHSQGTVFYFWFFQVLLPGFHGYFILRPCKLEKCLLWPRLIKQV